MGWSFEWASSLNNDFNRDFGVTFTQKGKDESRMNYNYKLGQFAVTECPGIGSFVRNLSHVFRLRPRFGKPVGHL